jgi:leucine dehydrogenase
MKVVAKRATHLDDLSGKKVLVQGIGHVGETAGYYLVKEGARSYY